MPRATRYPLRLHAHYRCEPSRMWHPAMTVNVSRAGVLLRVWEPIDAGCPIDVGSQIDVVFRLSHDLFDTLSGVIICQCRVVRIQSAPEDDDLLIAAEIATYGFERLRMGPSQSPPLTSSV